MISDSHRQIGIAMKNLLSKDLTPATGVPFQLRRFYLMESNLYWSLKNAVSPLHIAGHLLNLLAVYKRCYPTGRCIKTHCSWSL